MVAAIVAMLPQFNAGAQVILSAGSTSSQLSDLMIADTIPTHQIMVGRKARATGTWRIMSFDKSRQACGRQRRTSSEGLRSSQTTEQLQALDRAIQQKDGVQLSPRLTRLDLTNGCNACHRASGHSSITIQVPVNSPFSDQLFADRDRAGSRARSRDLRPLSHCLGCFKGNTHSLSRPRAKLQRNCQPAIFFSQLSPRAIDVKPPSRRPEPGNA